MQALRRKKWMDAIMIFFFKFKKIVKLSYKINRIGHGKIYPKHELSHIQMATYLSFYKKFALYKMKIVGHTIIFFFPTFS